jgi:hypothetical protein
VLEANGTVREIIATESRKFAREVEHYVEALKKIG